MRTVEDAGSYNAPTDSVGTDILGGPLCLHPIILLFTYISDKLMMYV